MSCERSESLQDIILEIKCNKNDLCGNNLYVSFPVFTVLVWMQYKLNLNLCQ